MSEPTITIPARLLESIDAESIAAIVLESVQYKREKAFGLWLQQLAPEDLKDLFERITEEEPAPVATRGGQKSPKEPAPSNDEEPKSKRTRSPSPSPDQSKKALEWLRDKGEIGTGFPQFEQENGLTEGQAKGLLKRWCDAGLVRKEKDGHGVTYIANPPAAAE